ncbi:uridine kinase [Paenibacillus sp. T1]|uniref:Uridine kinase n=1 Tax=Paenibacillus glycinis TaxID=2697035 RepID=A0ABW9XI12_9BACL|nr:uridine kinase [Paenibacillus glycinis]
MKYLFDKFLEAPKERNTLIIGIDGGGASGKSTLAQKFQALQDDVTVVHMDDFYHVSAYRNQRPHQNEIGGNWDWKRLLMQILEPLQRNEEGKYQIYDWDRDSLTDWHSVPVGGIVMIEGCYALREELSSLYDIRIWVDSPREFRLERGVRRDGGGNREMWEKVWLPDEDRYFMVQHPFDSADIIIDGTGHVGDINQSEVNVLHAPDGWF